MAKTTADEGWDLKRAGGIVRAADEAAKKRFAEEAQGHPPGTAKVGDLAIANCWPYPETWIICVVTRVDETGQPTHMRDGAGTRYADNARGGTGATIMPEYTWTVSRDVLTVPARSIAEENAGTRFGGVGGAHAVFERAVARYVQTTEAA